MLGQGDSLKLSQKSSSVTVTVSKEGYYITAKIVVPREYPLKQVSKLLFPDHDLHHPFPR